MKTDSYSERLYQKKRNLGWGVLTLSRMIANHRSLKEQYWYISTIIDYVDIWQWPLPSANLCKQKHVIPTASDKKTSESFQSFIRHH